MRKLVPELMIPDSVLNSLHCDDPDSVRGLIQMNVMMLKGSYFILIYSSIDHPEKKLQSKDHSLHL